MRPTVLYFPLLFVLILASCKRESLDTTAPTLTFIELSPEPVAAEICGSLEDSVFMLTGGENFTFTVVYKDETELSQNKLDIHNNFDCHGHGGASAPAVPVPNVSSLTEDWSVLEITNLSGTEQTVTHQLSVPENVTAGTYHFQVQVLDASGNDRPLANIYDISVKHPADDEAPMIMVTEPAGSSFSAAKGETITFKGTVTDNFSLSEGGNGVIFMSYTDLDSGNTFTTDAVISFADPVTTSYNFELSYTIPNTLITGDYLFTLRAYDGVRNIAEPISFSVAVD